MRICEDREIEPYGQLQALLDGGDSYTRLLDLFHRADGRYNSGLFHLLPEAGRETDLDTITPTLTLDDRAIQEIVGSLYYPECPYEFSVLGVDILGTVYEQFLGNVIRLTAGHHAVVEQKPEVRKAGGVFYTPDYIVAYIVRHTLGPLLAGQTPQTLGGKGRPASAPLRILDPACGSGSFLLGAYQFLLDWYLTWYTEHPTTRTARQAVVPGRRGQLLLTTEEKKRILLDHIYGVDIDPQAVEVTKLSLLLKVLEDENSESVQQLALLRERALPDLGRNIQCGNSLIGPEFHQGQMALLDTEEVYRINLFDWQAAFPDALSAGGFDAVIGNPPYVRIQTMKEWAPKEVAFYKKHYVAASKGNYDLYVVFVEKGLSLLNEHGVLGFILPHKFMNAQYGAPLRGLLAAGQHLRQVVHFGDQQVFANATTYTCLLFLAKGGFAEAQIEKVSDLERWRADGESVAGTLLAEHITAGEWNLVVGPGADLFHRLSEMPVKLGDVADRIAQGIRTSANEVYVLDQKSADGDLVTAYSKQLERDVVLERTALSIFLQGREIKPYRLLPSGKVVIIPYSTVGSRSKLLSEADLSSRFPKTYRYLLDNRSHLEMRERGRMRGRGWYGYVYPKNLDVMCVPKILVPDIADRASFALDQEGIYAFTSGYGIALKDSCVESVIYVLGLLNSHVLDFYLKKVSTTMRGGFFRYFTQFIEQLPIRTIDFADPAEAAQHDRLVALVEAMLRLHRELAAARVPAARAALQRQIEATDHEIDRLVYALYDLTAAEIALVEGR